MKPKTDTPKPTVEPIEATPSPTKTTRKQLGILLASIAAVVLVSAGIAAAILLTSVNPTDRFYQAIEKHMSLKYIGQHYKTEIPTIMGLDAGTYTDFTDVKTPKTKMHHIVTSNGKTIEDADYVVTGRYSDYVKIKTLSDGTSPSSAVKFDKNQWYKIGNETESQYVDFYQLGTSVNQTFGELLVGNYTADDRAALLKMYKNKQPFSFDPARDVTRQTIHGETAYVYSVQVDYAKLKEINQEAAKRLGLTATDPHSTAPTAEIAISEKTGRFIRYSATLPTLSATSVLEYSYPDTLSIETPSNTQPFSSILPESDSVQPLYPTTTPRSSTTLAPAY